ncbi:Molecular co-chaperone STI1 [Plasmopara halstedii]|uniref:Molecular co-chaperone STI1 n=1 Tax=Plasmopara halstedii TaxID=4781 RepID=A0A0P1A6A3_PLAHL|nr:Molecular co-chaperone STI1 [Plasmopara halstedii]CEG35448.1 Molecular co-chaperone STI1 [Plasmopara halstedii]|eukprot:XP_024571817.1 Molecular co-chaperone STI1 [Plasmopara halstedii]
MATPSVMANARLLQEHIENAREQLTQLQDQVDRYGAVADTLAELPNKISHKVMVPLGKRAMVPGKIVRSNEVLAHLGNEYFSWRSTSQAVEMIERKKKDLCKQIMKQEENLKELYLKKNDLSCITQLQKHYESENIREIQETEEESELSTNSHVTDEDIKEYFELEDEERLKQEQATWNWDDMMKRMEDLEAREAAGESFSDKGNTTKEESSTEEQAAALKNKGNEAFAKSLFEMAAQYYSQAIILDPTNHVLYGNRAAAYHRLKKYKLALESSENAVSLQESWVKGHYRKACALAALKKYEEAAQAYERAMELCPTDGKLADKAKQMREKAKAKVGIKIAQGSELKPRPATMEQARGFSASMKPCADPKSSSSSIISNTLASTAFSGSIVEHETSVPDVDLSLLEPRPSRFHGTNYTGHTVTLEPVGEAQPVKRVSRFKAARSARG